LYQNDHPLSIQRQPMSNPLLKPNDPRFQKPQVEAEANPFAESPAERASAGGPGSAVEEQNVFAPAAGAGDDRPFVPAYTAQQQPRFPILLVLGAVGWFAAVLGAIALAGLFDIGWLAPLLGLGPAGAAWLLAHEDLKAIRAGAIAAEAHQATRHAFWLGLTGLLACAGIVAAMIFREMHFLPDVL
jgi:hypothetical protein